MRSRSAMRNRRAGHRAGVTSPHAAAPRRPIASPERSAWTCSVDTPEVTVVTASYSYFYHRGHPPRSWRIASSQLRELGDPAAEERYVVERVTSDCLCDGPGV